MAPTFQKKTPMPPCTPSGPWVPTVPASPQYTLTPLSPHNGPNTLHPLVSIVVMFNCCHFATDHLHAVKTLIFNRHHFQLSSLCSWTFSGVCPVYNIPPLGVKGTSSVLWSSASFCSISQNMHYKAPAAAQQWKTNKAVWTWKDDWPPWTTSTYKRPFTQEGNYLVYLIKEKLV